MTLSYKLINVRTLARRPGIVFATIVNDQEQICVNATLDYCIQWLEVEATRLTELQPVSDSSPSGGSGDSAGSTSSNH